MSTGAAWADYDNDGYVDLFVAGYVDLDLNNLPDPGTNRYCRYARAAPVNCGPHLGSKARATTSIYNDGRGVFSEVSAKAGGGRQTRLYYGMGCVWLDFDNDGLIDLYVANDSTPNYLYRNLGNGVFRT